MLFHLVVLKTSEGGGHYVAVALMLWHIVKGNGNRCTMKTWQLNT
jgi:hypothetical protein